MSLTHGRLLVRADSAAPVLVTDDERQKADRGRQKKKKIGNYFIPTLS